MDVNALLDHIPEIDLIDDMELKQKVMAVFDAALSAGGWSLEDLHDMPFTLLITPCPMNMIEHIRGVTQVSYRSYQVFDELYKERNPLEKDILVAGALLHDIGKLVEYRRDKEGRFCQSTLGGLLRHPFSGVGLCYRFGLDGRILNAIAYHSKEGNLNKRTPEGKVIFHADFINFEPFHT